MKAFVVLCLLLLASTSVFAAVTISPTVISGGSQQLTATSGNSGGVTWTTTAGTVTSIGPLTSLFVAPTVAVTTKVTVTATGTGAQGKATVIVTVIPLPSVLTSVAVTPATAATYVGSTQSFTATAYDQYGNIFPGVAFTWSSSNPSAATVSPTTGLATGVAAGGTTITLNGVPAPVIAVGPTAANTIVPYTLAGPTMVVAVTHYGQTGATVSVPLAVTSPGIFPDSLTNDDRTQNGPGAPDPAGSDLSFIVTGFGLWNQPGLDPSEYTYPGRTG